MIVFSKEAKALKKSGVLEEFLVLMSEIEAGSWFDLKNPNHLKWLKSKISKRIGSGGIFYGFYDTDHLPIGLYCLMIEDHPTIAGHAELLDLGIIKTHRRKGYGRRLIQDAVSKSKAAGMYCLYVSTYEGDKGAIEFYRNCGFTPVATLPGLNGPNDQGQIYLQLVLDNL
ncbi:MAG: GNAT family N-acetyltransferase [Candidatus Cloacimonetes bacterium]|nr:GNAT family N-acetyltransferase [Candidatus Cloacimonadota bacterium]